MPSPPSTESVEYSDGVLCAQVYMILDEMFLGGEVQETSKMAIMQRLNELDRLE